MGEVHLADFRLLTMLIHRQMTETTRTAKAAVGGGLYDVVRPDHGVAPWSHTQLFPRFQGCEPGTGNQGRSG
jgi:hypothetical protein